MICRRRRAALDTCSFAAFRWVLASPGQLALQGRSCKEERESGSQFHLVPRDGLRTPTVVPRCESAAEYRCSMHSPTSKFRAHTLTRL
jgi:hypothetical protein